MDAGVDKAPISLVASDVKDKSGFLQLEIYCYRIKMSIYKDNGCYLADCYIFVDGAFEIRC